MPLLFVPFANWATRLNLLPCLPRKRMSCSFFLPAVHSDVLFFEALVCWAFPFLFLLEVFHWATFEGPVINHSALLSILEIKCTPRQPCLNHGGGLLGSLNCGTALLNWVGWYRPLVWQGTLCHIDAAASSQYSPHVCYSPCYGSQLQGPTKSYCPIVVCHEQILANHKAMKTE